MCIVFLYFCNKAISDGYQLIVASNRDEVYSRPTATARFWTENPNILAGTYILLSISKAHKLDFSGLTVYQW